jgi:predicted nucleic acid-binding Zn ribbon protein
VVATYAACLICGEALPPTSRADRRYCSARCRKRKQRLAIDRRPAEALTMDEAKARLERIAPQRWGPPPESITKASSA